MIDTRTALRNLLAAHDKLSKASGDARNQAIAAVEVAEDAAREALEADDGLALRMETDRADGNARSCHGFMAALKTIRDAAEEAIGMPWDIGGMPQPILAENPPAAPGEPCAVKPLEWEIHATDGSSHSSETILGRYVTWESVSGYWMSPEDKAGRPVSGGLNAAKAAAQADYEQRIRSVLVVTTPQPAAGWTCLARKQSLPEPAECNWPDCGCDPHAMKVIESLVEQGWTAPREAPAPAEEHVATVIYTNYRGDTAERRIIPRSVRYGSTNWHPEPQWLLLAYDCDKRAEREFALKDFGARPDTAEARLRKVQRLLDQFKRDATIGMGVAALLQQALSPPSGGDRAKESEGGAPMCDYTKFGNCYDVHLRCKWCPMRGKPDPSEPSPPADRREIVARIIEPNKWELIDAARAKGLDKWASDLAEPSLAKADAILAALAQSEEKK